MRVAFVSIILFSGLQVFLLFLAGFVYFWIKYEDEVTASGESLGFVIGESKEDVYSKVFANLAALSGKREEIFISIEVDSNLSPKVGVDEGFQVLMQTYMHPVGTKEFMEKDVWKFYLNASRFNVVKLTFCNDKLCEIYRHRKVFEIP